MTPTSRHEFGGANIPGSDASATKVYLTTNYGE